MFFKKALLGISKFLELPSLMRPGQLGKGAIALVLKA
jgi:hypothetical protein